MGDLEEYEGDWEEEGKSIEVEDGHDLSERDIAHMKKQIADLVEIVQKKTEGKRKGIEGGDDADTDVCAGASVAEGEDPSPETQPPTTVPATAPAASPGGLVWEGGKWVCHQAGRVAQPDINSELVRATKRKNFGTIERLVDMMYTDDQLAEQLDVKVGEKLIALAVSKRRLCLALDVLNILFSNDHQVSRQTLARLSSLCGKEGELGRALVLLRETDFPSLPLLLNSNCTSTPPEFIAGPARLSDEDLHGLVADMPVLTAAIVASSRRQTDIVREPFSLQTQAGNIELESGDVAFELVELCLAFGIVPTQKTFEALCDVCFKLGDLRAGVQTLKVGRGLGVTLSRSMYSAVLGTLCPNDATSTEGAADIAVGFSLMTDMKGDKVRPSWDAFVHFYRAVLDYGSEEQKQDALALCEDFGFRMGKLKNESRRNTLIPLDIDNCFLVIVNSDDHDDGS